MQCQDIEQVLAAKDEGTLTMSERHRLQKHLQRCPDCRDLAEQQARAVAALGSLGRVDVPRGLRYRVANAQPRRADVLRPWAFAAAMTVAVFAAWLALRPPTVPDEPTTPTPAAWARIEAAERDYQKAIAELEVEVAARSENWPPELRETFETNLAIIDEAIVDTREVAMEYADRPDAQRFLLAAYDQKVDLLTEATRWRF